MGLSYSCDYKVFVSKFKMAPVITVGGCLMSWSPVIFLNLLILGSRITRGDHERFNLGSRATDKWGEAWNREINLWRNSYTLRNKLLPSTYSVFLVLPNGPQYSYCGPSRYWLVLPCTGWFFQVLAQIPCLWQADPGKVWANTILTESSPELSHGGLIWGGHSVTSQSTHKTTPAVRLLWTFC